MNKYSLSALVAAGLLAGAATSASAADLGGNCCADLEERIAELEATTARKGNRKASLAVSGWVARDLLPELCRRSAGAGNGGRARAVCATQGR